MKRTEVRIGVSGWNYKGWRGKIYPKGLPQSRELFHLSRTMNSLEINGTFYSLQRPSSFRFWFDSTPDDFVFSIKGGRFITHIKRLKDCKIPLANFFASGIFALKHKLGPILWQLPPLFLYRPEVLQEFFDLLPRDTIEAAKLSKLTNGKVKEYPLTESEVNAPLRYALEVRHASFENPLFIEQLRKNKIALVFADTAGLWPYMEDLTTDFVYVRLHGGEKLYRSRYSPEMIRWWSKRLKIWTTGKEPRDAYTITEREMNRRSRDVFLYFDNTDKIYAPYDAQALSALIF